jgi:hypothetical protein
MLSTTERNRCIDRIRQLPDRLATAVGELSVPQLTTHYLPGEWTVAQNVHHLADSHMNSFIRLKLLLTEENPTIRPYDQDLWAMQPDANNPDIATSLAVLRGLHQRWVLLFASLNEAQWLRPGVHPESGPISVESLVQAYADHGEAHLDQLARTLAAA